MTRNWLSTTRTRGSGALAVALAASFVALAGCGTKPSPTAPGQKLVPLTLTVQSSAAASVRVPARAPAGISTPFDSTQSVDVTISKALLVVRDVRFKLSDAEVNDSTGGEPDSTGAGHDSTWAHDASAVFFDDGGRDSADADHEDGDGSIVFHGPFVIDLLSHHSANLDTQMVPPGTYRRVQGHLQPLQAADSAATPDLSFLVGSTVYLAGTIGGVGGGDFTFKARIHDEFMIRGKFTVDANTPATTFITFDASKWLVGRDGRFLDPRNPDDFQAIKWAIRHSIKVGMDANHDGKMDDDMHDMDH